MAKIFNHRSLFLSFFLATGLAIMGLTLSLSGFFYASYENDLLRAVSQNDHETLLQLNSYLSELLDLARTTASVLLMDPDILRLLDNPPIDRYVLDRQLDGIKKKILAISFLHSVAIYDSPRDSWYFTLTRQRYSGSSFIDAELGPRILRREDRTSLLPRTLSIQNSMVRINENLLTVVVFLNPGLRESFIAVNLNAQEVGYRMAQVSRGSSSASNQIFLVDTKGTIIAHSNRSQFGVSVTDNPLFTAVLANQEHEGTFIANDRGNRLVVSYIKRDDGYLIRTNAYAQIFASLIDMRFKIIMACILAIAVFMAATFALQRRLLRPLRSLTTKINRIVDSGDSPARPGNEVAILDHAFTITLEHLDSLRRYRESSQERLQSQLLEDLATGQANLVNVGPELANLGLDGLAHPAGELELLIVRHPPAESPAEIRGLLKTAGFPFAFGRADQIAALGFVNGTETVGLLKTSLAPLVALSCECAVGIPFARFSDLPTQYEALQKLSRLWFFLPDQPGILWQKDLFPDQHGDATYPVALEEKSQEALRRQRIADVRGFTTQFLERLPTDDFESAMLSVTRFCTAIFDAVGSMKQIRSLPNRQQFSRFLTQIHQSRYLRDVGLLFAQLYDQIEIILLANKGSRTMEIAEQIRHLIDQGSQDPNLSVKTLAERVKLTPAYTGQVFRQIFGQSIAQYLLDMRLDRARELMLDSQESVKEIACQVGIENYKYFYTRYKARFGISPGREMRSNRT